MNFKRMLLIAVLISIASVVVPPLLAQELPDPDNHFLLADRTFRGLNLSREQLDKIRPLVKDERLQVRAIRQNKSLTPKQKQDKIADLRSSSEQEIERFMSPDQRAKWEQALAEQEKRIQRVHEFLKNLGLTADQKARLAELRKSRAFQEKVIREDKTLTPRQRRTKDLEITRSTRELMARVFTTEQLRKLREFRQDTGLLPATPGEQKPADPGQRP